VTSLGDLCVCGDLASPGHELCGPCRQEAEVARAELVAEIAHLTAEEEAKIIDADEVAAA
jgi:hypothetical protein